MGAGREENSVAMKFQKCFGVIFHVALPGNYPAIMRIHIALVILLGLCAVRAEAFEHPGILESRFELEFMKKKVAAGEEPWKGALEKMQAKPEASLDFKATPREEVDCGSASRPDLGCTDEKRDSQAAYLHALIYAATGDEGHAKKSAEILHAWSILKTHGLSNAHLEAGWTGGPFVRAADILRSTWPGWTEAANAEFVTMMNRAFLPMVKEPQSPSTNGNWEAVMIETAMSIGVYEVDQKLFGSRGTRCTSGCCRRISMELKMGRRRSRSIGRFSIRKKNSSSTGLGRRKCLMGYVRRRGAI